MRKNKPNNTNDIILGLKAFANKNFEEANFYFQHAIKFDPQNPYLHKLNAMSYHLRGDLGDPDQYELALVGMNSLVEWILVIVLFLIFKELLIMLCQGIESRKISLLKP